MVLGTGRMQGKAGTFPDVGMRRMKDMRGTRAGQFRTSEYTYLLVHAGFDSQEFPGEDYWNNRMGMRMTLWAA
jgi:hypothetical protein